MSPNLGVDKVFKALEGEIFIIAADGLCELVEVSNSGKCKKLAFKELGASKCLPQGGYLNLYTTEALDMPVGRKYNITIHCELIDEKSTE